MKTAEGYTILKYAVNCPYCNKTHFDSDKKQWANLEYGEGKPYGEIKCTDCGETFEMSIGDEIV